MKQFKFEEGDFINVEYLTREQKEELLEVITTVDYKTHEDLFGYLIFKDNWNWGDPVSWGTGGAESCTGKQYFYKDFFPKQEKTPKWVTADISSEPIMEECLTEGKDYKVLDVTEKQFIILDDNGRIADVHKDWFDKPEPLTNQKHEHPLVTILKEAHENLQENICDVDETNVKLVGEKSDYEECYLEVNKLSDWQIEKIKGIFTDPKIDEQIAGRRFICFDDNETEYSCFGSFTAYSGKLITFNQMFEQCYD